MAERHRSAPDHSLVLNPSGLSSAAVHALPSRKSPSLFFAAGVPGLAGYPSLGAIQCRITERWTTEHVVLGKRPMEIAIRHGQQPANPPYAILPFKKELVVFAAFRNNHEKKNPGNRQMATVASVIAIATCAAEFAWCALMRKSSLSHTKSPIAVSFKTVS